MNMKESVTPRPTQSQKKALSHLQDALTTHIGNAVLVDLRKKYGIPKHGYKAPRTFYNVDNLNLPKKWCSDKKQGQRAELLNRLANDIVKIAKQFNLYLVYSIPSFFLDYVFYNAFGKTREEDEHLFGLSQSSMSLCHVSDMKEAHLMHSTSTAEEINEQNRNLGSFYSFFPLTIHVSPYASIRDIRDYVQKYSRKIKEIQAKYLDQEVVLNKLRERRDFVRRRNIMIWEFRDRPREKLRRAFQKKFPGQELPDLGAIGAIVSREEKRRSRKH